MAELDTVGVTRAYAGLKDMKISADDTYFESSDCFSEALWDHVKTGISCNTNQDNENDKHLITFAQRGHCDVRKLQDFHNADDSALIKFAWSE